METSREGEGEGEGGEQEQERERPGTLTGWGESWGVESSQGDGMTREDRRHPFAMANEEASDVGNTAVDMEDSGGDQASGGGNMHNDSSRWNEMTQQWHRPLLGPVEGGSGLLGAALPGSCTLPGEVGGGEDVAMS